MENTKLNNRLKTCFKISKWLLIVNIVLSGIAVICDLYAASVLAKVDISLTVEESFKYTETSDLLNFFVGSLQLLLGFVIFIFIANWIYLSHKNLRENIKAENLKFTPGWAVGWYFIPILNLWKPFQAMKELWRVSKNKENWWENSHTSKLLPAWWTLWIIAGIVGKISLKLSLRANTITALSDANLAVLLSDLIDIPLTIVFLLIVKKISEMQQKQLSLN